MIGPFHSTTGSTSSNIFLFCSMFHLSISHHRAFNRTATTVLPVVLWLVVVVPGTGYRVQFILYTASRFSFFLFRVKLTNRRRDIYNRSVLALAFCTCTSTYAYLSY